MVGGGRKIIHNNILPHQGNYNEACIPQDMGYCAFYTMTCACGSLCVSAYMFALSSCDVFPAGSNLQSDSDIYARWMHQKLLAQHRVSDFSEKKGLKDALKNPLYE